MGLRQWGCRGRGRRHGGPAPARGRYGSWGACGGGGCPAAVHGREGAHGRTPRCPEEAARPHGARGQRSDGRPAVGHTAEHGRSGSRKSTEYSPERVRGPTGAGRVAGRPFHGVGGLVSRVRGRGRRPVPAPGGPGAESSRRPAPAPGRVGRWWLRRGCRWGRLCRLRPGPPAVAALPAASEPWGGRSVRRRRVRTSRGPGRVPGQRPPRSCSPRSRAPGGRGAAPPTAPGPGTTSRTPWR